MNDMYANGWSNGHQRGIVVYDMMTDKYHLPEMHARMLTRTHEG